METSADADGQMVELQGLKSHKLLWNRTLRKPRMASETEQRQVLYKVQVQ